MAHLRARLQFPLHPLFVDIFKYYQVQLGQLMSNVIRTTVGFLMACRAFDLSASWSYGEDCITCVKNLGHSKGMNFFILLVVAHNR